MLTSGAGLRIGMFGLGIMVNASQERVAQGNHRPYSINNTVDAAAAVVVDRTIGNSTSCKDSLE